MAILVFSPLIFILITYCMKTYVFYTNKQATEVSYPNKLMQGPVIRDITSGQREIHHLIDTSARYVDQVA